MISTSPASLCGNKSNLRPSGYCGASRSILQSGTKRTQTRNIAAMNKSALEKLEFLFFIVNICWLKDNYLAKGYSTPSGAPQNIRYIRPLHLSWVGLVCSPEITESSHFKEKYNHRSVNLYWLKCENTDLPTK